MTKKRLLEILADVPDDQPIMLAESGGQSYYDVTAAGCQEVCEYDGNERNGIWAADNKPTYGQKPVRKFSIVCIW